MCDTRSAWHSKLTNIFLCSFPRSARRERERQVSKSIYSRFYCDLCAIVFNLKKYLRGKKPHLDKFHLESNFYETEISP